MRVMLRRDWQGTFRRTVRDAAGVALRVLEFAPGQIVELLDEERPAIAADVGRALLAVDLDDKSRPRVIAADPPPETRAAAPEQDAPPGPMDGPAATLTEALQHAPDAGRRSRRGRRPDVPAN